MELSFVLRCKIKKNSDVQDTEDHVYYNTRPSVPVAIVQPSHVTDDTEPRYVNHDTAQFNTTAPAEAIRENQDVRIFHRKPFSHYDVTYDVANVVGIMDNEVSNKDSGVDDVSLTDNDMYIEESGDFNADNANYCEAVAVRDNSTPHVTVTEDHIYANDQFVVPTVAEGTYDLAKPL